MNPLLAMAVNAALAALPVLIHSAEQIHGPDKGATKHNAVTDAIIGLVSHVPELRADLDKLRGALSPVISSVVGLMNAFATLKSEGVVAAGPALLERGAELVREAAGAVDAVRGAAADVAHQAGAAELEQKLAPEQPDNPRGSPAEGAAPPPPHEREGAATLGGTVEPAASMGG